MTLVDYPGHVGAALFTAGCNFRCPFCHNPELVDPSRFGSMLDVRGVLDRLRERVGFIEGVVISGGEPTIHPELKSFIVRLKELGFLVKLDTNGAYPEALAEILERHLVDYIAMDVKAPFDAYDRLTGTACDVEAIEASIQAIVETAPDYEFRTTVAPTLGREGILSIVDRIQGAKRYVLQPFRVAGKGLLDPTWETKTAMSKAQVETVWREIRSRFPDGGVRG